MPPLHPCACPLQRLGAPSPDGSADGLAREVQILKDRMSQQTNRMAVLEQKVRRRKGPNPPMQHSKSWCLLLCRGCSWVAQCSAAAHADVESPCSS
jgi:hypothetical protein